MPAHILIVDADPYAAHVTRAIVARAAPEADLEVVATPEAAGLSVEREFPDVLIIDPAPQSQAARDLIAEVKAAAPASRVLVLAAAPSHGLRRIMERLGVDAYLEKPVPFPRLLAELRAVMGTR